MNRKLQCHMMSKERLCIHFFQIRLEFRTQLVFVEGGNTENPQKDPWTKTRSNKRLNSLMIPEIQGHIGGS